MNESIRELKEEIKQKRAVIYELDLKNSLEEEKSAGSEIKQTVEYWEFVCERGEEIPFSNFEVIFGTLSEKDGYAQGKTEPYQQNKAIFSAIAELNKEYHILKIQFRGKRGQSFQVFVLSADLCQAKKELKENIFKDTKSRAVDLAKLDLLQAGMVFNIDEKNRVTVSNGDYLYAWRVFNYTCTAETSFYLDYKLAEININQENWRQTNVALDRRDYFELRAREDCSVNDFFDIYKVTYAKNTGYVYLKPILLPKGNYEIFLYHTGEIEAEYYHEENWLMPAEKINLTAPKELLLRLKMNSGSKLYDLLIAE